jgi:hypothetical protein
MCFGYFSRRILAAQCDLVKAKKRLNIFLKTMKKS